MMITDKILIFFLNPLDINMGGPSGFLAHNLLDKPQDQFIFVTRLFNPNRLKYLMKNRYFGKPKNYEEFIFKETKAEKYKYILFHDCYTLEKCRHLIKDNQIVILQSHSPELPSEELANLSSDEKLIDFTRKAENNSFQRANYIIFPTEGSVELYKDLNFDLNKVRYLLSGCKDAKDLKKYPLESSKINLLYIGRRNEIKGFDIILESFIKANSVRNDLNLLVAGKGEKLNIENVYDVGFTNTPLNWFYSVDFVLNANRKSYFDLSVLEALSVGSRLIMSDNYGHSFFKNISQDIITYNIEDKDGLSDVLLSERVSKFHSPSTVNRKIYLDNFTDNLYYKRFIDFFSEIKSQTP